MKNELIYEERTVSNCCTAPVYKETEICSACGEACHLLTLCLYCDGKGDVGIYDQEYRKNYGAIIDPPVKNIICPKCGGNKYED